jgi:hypothetical protein
VRVAVAAFLFLGGVAVAAVGGGLFFGSQVISLDVVESLAKVPVAAQAGFDELEQALIDQGYPPTDLADVRSGFADALASIEEATSGWPTLVPVPLVCVGVEISLPAVVIDGVRASLGILNDGILREAAGWAGLELPMPLFDAAVEVGEETATFVADVTFSTWTLSLDAVKRIDVFVAAVNLFAGGNLVRGRIDPRIDVDVPAEWDDGVSSALDALNTDGLTWSSFSLHAGLGLELGLPFLRIYADVRFVLPFGQTPGWWNLRVGRWAGALGMVIRF